MGASLRVQKPLAAEKGAGPGAMSGVGSSDTLGGDKLQDGFAGADPLQDTLQVAAPANNPDVNAAPGQSGKAKLEHQEPNKDKDAQADKEDSNQPADGESATRAQGGPGGAPGDAPAPRADPTGGGGAPDPKGAGPPEDGPADKSKGAEAAKKEQAGASPAAAGGGAGGGAPAPASPEDDPAFQQVKAAVEAAGEAQQEHPTGEAAASDAQGAAVGPPNEGASQAAAAQTEKMDAQEPGTFDKKAFKDAVAARIESLTPKNLDGLDKFKESGGVGQVKADVTGQVTSSKDAAAQGIEKTTTEEPDPSKAHPKEVTPLEVTEAGAAPQISAAGAAPKPRPDSDLSLEQGPQELDAMMSEADVTEEQLLNSNEPDFVASVDAKKAAEADSATQPGLARTDEAAAIQAAQAGAQGDADQQLAAMNQARAAALGQIEATQGDTKTEDETARAKVATQIEKIYDDTKSAVETRLKKLDEDVDSTFDAGAKSAQAAFEAEVEAKMDAWKAERYAGIDGKARWVADLFRDLPPEVNQFYSQARNNYVTAMNGVIDEVASVVETGLIEAKQLIAEGRQKVADYVKGLPETLKGVGAEAASEIEGRFAELDQTVENKQGELVDHLAQRYTESLKTIDTRIEEMKEANKGWISQAKDKVAGTLETIRGLKDMLLGVLSRGANAIGLILKDPIGFLGNLVSGVGAGLKGFLGNIGEHMKKGLMDWLFGAVAEAGLTLPDNFDLKGILDLVMQVLGLTKDAFRARAVELLGEPVVNAIETGVEIFKIVMTQGVVGLWSYIKDRLGDLKEMVLGAIREWVTGKIITAGITWILGLLNPAGAFIKACKAIYDIIMFFVERGSQILSLVNAVIDSVTSIAQGSTGAAAKAIEGALAKALPVAIGFLASLLGVTGISKFIRGAIDKVREPVSKAIDWVIKKAKDLAGSILEKLGFGKKEEEGDGQTNDADEKRHQEMADEAASTLSKPPSNDIAYTDLKAQKEEEARGLETQYNALIEPPTKMSIAFADGDGDTDAALDFQIVIAPNDTKRIGEIKVDGTGPDPVLGEHPIAEKSPPEKREDRRESHHYPEASFAKAIDNTLKAQVTALGESDDPALSAAVTPIESMRNIHAKISEDGIGLSAILLHWQTHRGGGGGAHSKVIGEKTKDALAKYRKRQETAREQELVRLIPYTKKGTIVAKGQTGLWEEFIARCRKELQDPSKRDAFESEASAVSKDMTQLQNSIPAEVASIINREIGAAISLAVTCEIERSSMAISKALAGSKKDGTTHPSLSALMSHAKGNKYWQAMLRMGG